jgi:hypothetical protein
MQQIEMATEVLIMDFFKSIVIIGVLVTHCLNTMNAIHHVISCSVARVTQTVHIECIRSKASTHGMDTNTTEANAIHTRQIAEYYLI